MICHVVLIRLKESVLEPEAERFLEDARRVLGSVPGVQNLRVGKGLGVKAEIEHPYALVMEFPDEAALEAYQVHPEHQRFVREIVGPIQDDKRVYDYRC